jgi:hypothetical protein
MGFFDTIICDYPLLNPKDQLLEFQTKSLEPEDLTYKIDRQGQLWLVIGRQDEQIELASRPINVSGEIIFYDVIDHGSQMISCLEYSFHYIDGRLRGIRQTERYQDYRESVAPMTQRVVITVDAYTPESLIKILGEIQEALRLPGDPECEPWDSDDRSVQAWGFRFEGKSGNQYFSKAEEG